MAPKKKTLHWGQGGSMGMRQRVTPYGAVCILGLALTLLAAPAIAAPAEAGLSGGASNWSSTLVSLERVGFRDGFTVEGSQGTRRLFFPLPPGVPVARAQLSFDVEFGELVIPESSLQFRVNDVVRQAVRRGESGIRRRVDIPLTAQDLEKDFVRLELDYALFVHPDVCLSQKLVGAYAHLSPSSGLAVISADPLPRTVQAALSLLPRDVTVATSLAELTPDQFQALFALSTTLFRHGHVITYENLAPGAPTRAHIVLAPGDSYPAGGEPLAGGANLRLVRSGAGAFILIDSARAGAAAAMLRLPWRDATVGGQLDVTAAAGWPQPRDPDEIVRLKTLGFDDSERLFGFSTDWHISLPFGPMGNGERPARAALEIYGPKVAAVRGPTFISAYFNDRLVHSAALKELGKSEVLEFDLPRLQLRARNNLKVVAQRDQTSGDCKLAQASYPLSLSPDSVIETRPLNETPVTFAELVPHQQRLEVHVARDALASPATIIPMLVTLGEHFWPDVPAPALRVFEPGAEIKPAGPFFVIGDAQWAPRAYVQFDQGRVRLRSVATGEPLMLLDFAADTNLTVLQMVEAGNQGGAWLKTTAGYASGPPRRALLEDENLAFLGPTGGMLALKIGETRDYRVDYPEAKGWFEETGAVRPALFIVAWAVIIGLLVYLYRRSRRLKSS